MPERPASNILETLKGKVSEPIETVSNKPGFVGQTVKTRLVLEGSGMIGLEDALDNREWSGMFNHILKTARVATFLARELKERGEQVDPAVVLNTILVSHCGRRNWDEANWYPEAVVDAEGKRSVDNTEIGLEILKKSGVDQTIIDNVEAHMFPAKYPPERMDSWEKRLALYCDYRIDQRVRSVEERLEDLKRAVVDGRITEDQRLFIRDWALSVEKEIFAKIGLEPEQITDEFPQRPRWERYLRRLFMQDAEAGIFERLSQLEQGLEAGEIGETQIDREFPKNTWWGKYARELFEAQNGKPYQQHVLKARGIARAIDFFRSLEQKGQARKLNEHALEFRD